MFKFRKKCPQRPDDVTEKIRIHVPLQAETDLRLFANQNTLFHFLPVQCQDEQNPVIDRFMPVKCKFHRFVPFNAYGNFIIEFNPLHKEYRRSIDLSSLSRYDDWHMVISLHAVP